MLPSSRFTNHGPHRKRNYRLGERENGGTRSPLDRWDRCSTTLARHKNNIKMGDEFFRFYSFSSSFSGRSFSTVRDYCLVEGKKKENDGGKQKVRLLPITTRVMLSVAHTF